MNTVALLGAPFDANSSFLRGAAMAPARVRETLHNGSSNWTTELGVDLNRGGWLDAGDVALASGIRRFAAPDRGRC